MADDIIDVLVRLRGALGASRDARRVASGINDIGDEARQTARDLALMNTQTGRGRGVSQSFAKSLNNVSGRLKLATAGAAFLGPALVSVASSAGAAALGLGLAGAAAGAAAAVGFGGLVLAGKQAFGMLSNVKTAQSAYNLAVAEHGRKSKEAAAAQDKLNATLKVAGPQARALWQEWTRLQRGFRGRTGGARRDILGGALDGIRAARRLLPAFTQETNRTAHSLRGNLRTAFLSLSTPEMAGNIRAFSRAFRSLSTSAVGGGTNLIIALLRYARAALPFVRQLGQGFAMWAAGFRRSSDDGGHVRDVVRDLVGHARAWLRLFGAVGRLMLAVFGQSKDAGKGLVDQLTRGVDWMTRMVQSIKPGSWQAFAALAELVGKHIGQFLPLVFQLAREALPGLLVSGAMVAGVFKVLATVLAFLSPLIPPLIVAYTAWRIATTALTIAQTLLDAALALNPFGIVVVAIVAVVAAVILMWHRWAGFRNFIKGAWAWMKQAATDTAQWIVNAFGNVTHFLGSMPGKISTAARNMWDGLKSGLIGVVNWIIGKLNSLIDGVNKVGSVIGVTIPNIGTIVDTVALGAPSNVPRGRATPQGGTYAAPTRRRGRPARPAYATGGGGARTAKAATAGPARDRWLQPVHWQVGARTLASVVVDVSEAANARGG